MSDVMTVNERVNEACTAAVLEVLETMFFELPVEEPEAAAAVESGAYDFATVEFAGTSNGRLMLAGPRALTAPLAESFLADDSESEDSPVTQVLGELANMFCGNALGRFDSHGAYKLAPPSGRLGESAEEISAAGVSWTKFQLENGPLYVGMSVD